MNQVVFVKRPDTYAGSRCAEIQNRKGSQSHVGDARQYGSRALYPAAVDHHLEKGYIVIFAGGNGQPYVTTDYPSVQRAIETNSCAILVAKHGVDGVFDHDPRARTDARRYASLPYDEVLERNLKVMDQSAFILAREYKLPIHVFDFDQTGSMKAICEGNHVGTFIGENTAVEYAESTIVT